MIRSIFSLQHLSFSGAILLIRRKNWLKQIKLIISLVIILAYLKFHDFRFRSELHVWLVSWTFLLSNLRRNYLFLQNILHTSSCYSHSWFELMNFSRQYILMPCPIVLSQNRRAVDCITSSHQHVREVGFFLTCEIEWGALHWSLLGHQIWNWQQELLCVVQIGLECHRNFKNSINSQ